MGLIHKHESQAELIPDISLKSYKILNEWSSTARSSQALTLINLS